MTHYNTLNAKLSNSQPEKNVSWKSRGFLTEQIVTPTTADSLSLTIKRYGNSNVCLTFKLLKTKKATFTLPNITIFLLSVIHGHKI